MGKPIKTLINNTEIPAQVKNQELVRKQRGKIVNSSVNLFIKNGYHGTTTRMIAEASNLSIGSLYDYVSSKEALLYLVCETIHGELEIAVKKALSKINEEENKLVEVIRQYFYVCDKMEDHIIMMYHITQFLPKKLQKRVLQKELDIIKIFENIISSITIKKKSPEMSNKALNLICHNIAVLGQMWVFRRWTLQQDYTIEEYIKYQTELLLTPLVSNVRQIREE